tara:strand:+ start:3829 stop:3990 length:162 start_codon:yes stop_codon:yes gene_type:complete
MGDCFSKRERVSNVSDSDLDITRRRGVPISPIGEIDVVVELKNENEVEIQPDI